MIENFATCGLRPTGWSVTSSHVTRRIGARFVPNLNLDRYVHTHFLSARSDRELVHYTFWTTVRRQNSWQNGKLETIAWLIEMHIRVIQTRFLFLFFIEFNALSCSICTKTRRNGILWFNECFTPGQCLRVFVLYLMLIPSIIGRNFTK